MITQNAFKDCLSKVGDVNPHISGIKRFLNSFYGVKKSDLSNDRTFCWETAQALTEFQRFKGLSLTGRMNIETWRAIGKELGIRRFENLFFHPQSYSVTHKLAFGKRFVRMFPTKTHNLIVEYTFLEGGNSYGNIGGGLSSVEVEAIALGSRQTDTYFGHGKEFGTGFEIDIPITLLISEAYKHAMVPEGMKVEDAQKKGHEWIVTNTREARRIQRDTDEKRQNAVKPSPSGKPVPSSLPHPVIAAGGMDLNALTVFGKACHTYMDSESPAHHGWQEYNMPKKSVKITNPSGEETEIDSADWSRFIREGLQHKSDESEKPTEEQKNQCVLYMRGAFLATFTNKWFKRAVKSESEREKTYSFLRSKGISWSEDFWVTTQNSNDLKQVEIPRNKIQN